MKRLIYFIILISTASFGQTQPPTQTFNGVLYQYKNSLRVDSNFFLPKRDTSGFNSALTALGNIRMRPADSIIYYWKGTKWQSLLSSVDTTSLSTRINAKADTLRLNDSLAVQTLETVTAKGNTTPYDIYMDYPSQGRFRWNVSNNALNRFYSQASTGSAFRPLWIGSGGLVISDIAGSLVGHNGVDALQVQGSGKFNGTIRASRAIDSNQVINLAQNTDTLNERRKELGYINVRWFGAKGDGVTDDREAIQAALDAIPNGGSLYFPPTNLLGGTFYKVSSPGLVIDKMSVRLYGDANNTAYGVAIKSSGSNFNLFTVNHAEVIFDGLSLVGDGSYTIDGDGAGSWGTGATITGILVNGAEFADGDLVVKGCSLGGFVAGIKTKARNLNCVDNLFYQCQEAIVISTLSFPGENRGFYIHRNRFHSIGDQFGKSTVRCEDPTAFEISIFDNYLDGQSIARLADITATKNIDVMNNFSTLTRTGLVKFNGVKIGSITGNTHYGNQKYKQVYPAIELDGSSFINISGNNISDVPEEAIKLNGFSRNNQINTNYIKDWGDSTKQAGGSFYGLFMDSICLQNQVVSNQFYISNNTQSDAGDIFFFNNSTSIYVRNKARNSVANNIYRTYADTVTQDVFRHNNSIVFRAPNDTEVKFEDDSTSNYATLYREQVLNRFSINGSITDEDMTEHRYLTFYDGSTSHDNSQLILQEQGGSVLVKDRLLVNDAPDIPSYAASIQGILLMTNPDATKNRYILTNGESSGDKRLTIQAGEGSDPWGGAINLYGNSHATYPGQVRLGLSNGTGKFVVNTAGLGESGTDVFSADAAGVVIINGVHYRNGTGSPEGVVTAPVGSVYTNKSGGAGTTLYIKESGSGNTGWIAK